MNIKQAQENENKETLRRIIKFLFYWVNNAEDALLKADKQRTELMNRIRTLEEENKVLRMNVGNVIRL